MTVCRDRRSAAFSYALNLSRSRRSRFLSAGDLPVQMFMPGTKKTHRAYVWAYATSRFSGVAAVVYDFSPSLAGEHARNFLHDWKGKLVCDDFDGYNASFELGVTEVGRMAHSWRKFFELHAARKSRPGNEHATQQPVCDSPFYPNAHWIFRILDPAPYSWVFPSK